MRSAAVHLAMRVTCLVVLMLGAVTSLVADDLPRGVVVEGLHCANDSGQGYALYLPSTFDSEAPPPALLVFDPRSRARLAAELFQAAAERFGWIILSSANTMSDGDMEPNLRAIRALWPEAINRHGADPRRIHATGFSGGAHVAYHLGQIRPQLAGVIACGGRLIPTYLANTTFPLFATAGTVDYNQRGMQRVTDYMAEQGRAHRLEIFPGAHQWMPRETAELAVAWMELQAMRSGLREVDEGLVAELLQADMAAAAELEANGDLLAAQRRFEAVAESFVGLADVRPAATRAAALADSTEVRQASKLEAKLIVEEDEFVANLSAQSMALVVAAEPIPARALSKAIGVPKLQKRAAGAGADAVAAERMLNAARAVTGFYLARDLRSQGRPAHAAEAIRVALEIRSDDSFNLYNLGCALAQAGQVEEAIDTVREAIAHGFNDASLLRSDSDLDPLRELPRFQRLLDSLP